MSSSTRNKIAFILSFVIMMILFIIPQRGFIPKGEHFYGVYVTQVVAFLGILIVLALLAPELLKRKDFKQFLRTSWPLLLYTAIEIGFLIFGYFNQHPTDGVKTFRRRWWFNYFFLLLLIPGTWTLGYAVKWSAKKQSIFMTVVFSLTSIIVFGEYLYGNGINNPVGQVLHYLNTRDIVWQWNPAFESLRVSGFHTFPAVLATMAAIGVVWVFSLKVNRYLKVALFIDAIIIIVLSGSRTELLTVILLCFVAMGLKIKKLGFLSWLKKNLPLFIAVLVIGLALGTVFVVKYQKAFSAGVFNRLEQNNKGVDELLSSQKKSKTIQILDTLSSGRVVMWIEAVNLIKKHPLGTGRPSGLFLQHSHAHDDFLSKYITEGPLGIFLIFLMLWWMWHLKPRKTQEHMGLYFAVMCFGILLTNCVFLQTPVLSVPLFLMGANSDFSERELPQPQES